MEKGRTDGVTSMSLDTLVKEEILRIISRDSGDCTDVKSNADDVSAANALAASQFLAVHGTTAIPSSSALMEIGNMDANDPNREKLVLSEIEKFRIRQAQRDK